LNTHVIQKKRNQDDAALKQAYYLVYSVTLTFIGLSQICFNTFVLSQIVSDMWNLYHSTTNHNMHTVPVIRCSMAFIHWYGGSICTRCNAQFPLPNDNH